MINHATSRFIHALFTIVVISTAAMGQTPVDRERGFKPGMLYQFNDLDSISLANGNLNLSIPLGSYRVSANVAYDFTLHYSGNLWEERNFEVQKAERTYWVPQQDNVGLGWRLSFGELHVKSSLFARSRPELAVHQPRRRHA